MTDIKFRPIKLDEDNEVYQMFQEIPAEENGFYNTAYGLSKKEFKAFCQEELIAAKE